MHHKNGCCIIKTVVRAEMGGLNLPTPYLKYFPVNMGFHIYKNKLCCTVPGSILDKMTFGGGGGAVCRKLVNECSYTRGNEVEF